ncbi:MAG: class I SAM-dependent methyltransferase [Alphaproteobacteria bacterium]|nr:class I SAM-dependent methyltransferase [Alphaproteobacteria bacterium]
MDISQQYNQGGMALVYREQSLARQGETDPTRERIPAWLPPLPRSSRLLDVGCGSGLDLFHFHQMGFRGLCGTDAAEAQCVLAAQTVGAAGSIFCADTAALPFRAAAFDVVTSRYMVHYARDLEAVMRELARVTKEGGHLMIVTGHPDYDARRTDKHNGDGTISYTLFGGQTPITYPLHTMEEYTGAVFQRYFTMVELHADPSPTLDDTKPGDRPALCFLARRNAQHVCGA